MNLKKSLKQKVYSEKIIESDFHGIVELAMGVGKTKIVIDAIRKQKFKSILWVCGTEKFRDKGLKEEFISWKGDFTKVKAICWHSLSDLKGSFDLIVLDEVQMITERRFNYFRNNPYNKILALTGTLPREWSKLRLLEKLNLKTIVSVDVDEAIEEELIADYEIEVVYCYLNDKIKKEIKSKKGVFYATERESYDWYSRKIAAAKAYGNYAEVKSLSLRRANFIYNSKSKLKASLLVNSNLKGRIVSFSKRTEIADMLGTPFHTKIHKKKRDQNYADFNSGKISHLATVEAANTSLNLIDVECVFIQQLDSNAGNFFQRMGRGLRLRKDYVAKIIIMCLKDTQDEIWVSECISSLNPKKITYVS